jgi:hypothetical protein
MAPKVDEKWNPKSTVIVAQKKQNQRISTTNPEGLNARSHHDSRVHHQKTSSTTQDKGDILN